MTVSTRLTPPVGGSLRLVTLGDAALCVSTPGAPPERILQVGKPLALLIYLACSNGREAPREHLTDLLWSHMERERAQNSLRQTIWQIRSRLGDDIIAATRDRVSLIDSVEIDRDAFLAASAAPDVERVINLYRGDFVTGFAAPGGASFEHWADLERLALRRIFVRSVEEVVQQRLASGRARDALILARRARDLDRLNQRAWRLTLECFIAAGDSVGAHVEADALAHLLDAEEIEPEVATHAALREARATSTGSSSSTSLEATPGLVAELTGREREFATIMRSWDDVGRDRARHFHIVAAAGYGKTRVLSDVQNRLRGARGRAVYIRADFGARDIAYSFASEVALRLSKLRGAGGISPSAAGTLVALNPSLSSSFSAERDVAVDDEALRRRGLALRELITTVAEEQPVALLLDDLHWSDAASFRALDMALAGIDKTRLLVVSAGRPITDDGRRPAHATPISLAPLTVENVGALVSSLANLPSAPWADRLPRALCDATGGSPLLVLETLQLLIERSLLVRSDERWSVSNADEVFRVLAEGSALRRRVASLDSTEGSLLLLLAVSGVPLERSVLAEAAAHSIAEIAAPVAILEQRGLVLRHGDLLSVAHDEHGAAAIEAASAEATREAAGSAGRAILSHAHGDARRLCVAGSLLARAGDAQLLPLSTAFEGFVRAKRLIGDRRADRALARELLGSAATDRRESYLIGALPWLVRARLVSRARIAMTIAACGICLLSGVGALMALSRPVPPPDVVLVATRLSTDHKSFDIFPVPLEASRWAGINVINVPVSGRPRWRTKLVHGNGGRDTRPDGRGWTAGVVVSDTGVVDIHELGLDGSVKRLTFAASDDYGPSWAPDNSRFVFVTARWSRHGHYDLAIYDSLTHGVRQLTQGDDTDGEPAWSPDGSRIAFIRQYAESGGRGLCLVDADGGHLRCLPPEPGVHISLARWTDAHRLLSWRVVGTTQRLARVNVETGIPDLLVDGLQGAIVSPDGRFILCTCPRPGHASGTPIVYPLERPNEFAVLHVVGGDTRAVDFGWAPITPRLPFIDRMAISFGLGPPKLGASHQLRAAGIDADGNTVAPGVVRWRSEDTTVAVVDSSGRLTARRPGRVAIDASAGGWRDVRTEITIEAPKGLLLLDEDWGHGLEPSWQLFGNPKPVVVTEPALGHAFLNNGDGVFFSGAFTTHAYSTRDGLWVDAELSSSITAPESQEQVFTLMNMVDSAAWASWDRVTGDGPAGASSPNWGIRYPAGVGGTHIGEQIAILGPSGTAFINMPPGAGKGQRYQLTMQIFPDGHCAVALNGREVWTSAPSFLEPSVRLMLAGNSVNTRMLVGHLRIGAGLAPNITWPR